MRPRALAVAFLLFILHALALVDVALSQAATATESKQVFRTYPFGDPDPVARMGNIYPYFRFEGYSIKPVDREWNIVTLENPFIKLLIAPEMGGKMLGAFEKPSGRAFIYFNNVIKFREIAMRGPWTSGGLEFNFGDIGHTPTTATPVDYLVRTNDDGSASCIIGAMDLASRTEWRVEIRLPSDRAYFETRSFWYNPTDLNTSLYHWMCVGADADEDLRFLYPGTSYIGHGGDAHSWSINKEGRDVSFYHNNAFGSNKSYHVLGTYTDYFGAHWANDDVGVIHWSRYADKPGKKIWIWARSREGEIWKDLLTDPEIGNKQYVEIQSGLLFNQAVGGSSRTPFKHLFFAPLSAERFEEAWFPFAKIGGAVEANLFGTINVKREGNDVKIGFCPLQFTKENLLVNVSGRSVYSKSLDLKPLEAFVDVIRGAGGGEIEVSVGDHISYRSGDEEARKLRRPTVSNKEFDWNSVAGLYTDGLERARQRDAKGALEKFLACLSKDPVYTPALVGAAEMYYRRMEYDSALWYASKALANDAYDPDANFIYGVTSRTLGRLYDAQDGFGAAARAMKYRSAGSVQLAEIAFLRNNLADAEEYARQALDYDRYNVRAYRLLAVTFRKEGRNEDARIVLERMLEIDPLCHFANFEHFLLDPSGPELAHFKSMIRNEFPQETYLELAIYYWSLGLTHEAISMLENAPEHPIILYWLAYLHDQTKNTERSRQYLERASQLSPRHVFPFRPETAEILKWADAQSPSWKSKYFLGLLSWSKNRFDEAKRYLAECGDAPDFAAFYLTRGNLHRRENPAAALKDYLRAYDLEKSEWRVYRTLADYYNEVGDHARALEVARVGASTLTSNYVLQFGLAKTLLFNGQYGPSLSILDTITILPFEGAGYGRAFHRQVSVLSATEAMKKGDYVSAVALLDKARQWPERLGVGKPYDVDNRLEDYLEALCQRRLGQVAKADSLLSGIARYTEGRVTDWGTLRLVAALAHRELGKKKDAQSTIDTWLKRSPESLSARWSSAIFWKDPTKRGRVEKEIRKGFAGSLLSQPTVDGNLALMMEVEKMIGLK